MVQIKSSPSGLCSGIDYTLVFQNDHMILGSLYQLKLPQSQLLLSQIRDSTIVHGDRIHRKRGHTINQIKCIIKLAKEYIKAVNY